MLKLVIGNRNYSSWSLRAWLHLRESGLAFEELRLPLYTPAWDKEIARYSPARRVPVLVHDGVHVWDSLAIILHVLEHFPRAVGWPSEPAMRAHAQSVSAEMHSGFLAVRDELPQNLRQRRSRPLEDISGACARQIERILDIWSECRERHGRSGPWLFGEFSIADVMYAPVALRFLTYAIAVPAPASEFVAAVDGLPSVREWCEAASAEPERLPFFDERVPAKDNPLTLG